jgi:hypothetical protein
MVEQGVVKSFEKPILENEDLVVEVTIEDLVIEIQEDL